MAAFSGIMLWSNIDLGFNLEFLDGFNGLLLAIFIIGVFTAFTALLGMIMSCCAKCAANPDGKCDGCEKCCTPVFSILYILILSVLLVGTLVIAGFLTYFTVIQQDSVDGVGGAACPYPDDSTQLFIASNTTGPDGVLGINSPDPITCPLDALLYEVLYPSIGGGDGMSETTALLWGQVQNSTLTCGYYCDQQDGVQYCSPDLDSGIYSSQTTGYWCYNDVSVDQNDITVYEGLTTDFEEQAYAQGAPSTMPYRPTFFAVFATYLIPLLVVWWCLFLFSLLLIIAACAMCIRKKNTKKNATYKPDSTSGSYVK